MTLHLISAHFTCLNQLKMANTTLAALANELAVAVEITMNPQASQQQRMDAYIACEK